MKKTQYNPIDVANYIVWRANAIEKPITHLKLQKLLYYVVAKYAKDHDTMLINEDIVKWQYGPVAKSVYHYFKLYGHNEITKPIAYLTSTEMFHLTFANVDKKISELSGDDLFETVADSVLDKLIDFSAFDLVERTHQESAWKDFEIQILQANQDLPYSLTELKMANI
ncbi:Panacea domain-containing protein [Moraxella boevrei]|uniref:Panacea domain-containing protein n=1 Tax=Faucicola boevrei TaxID=346665 RepID=UPI003734EDF8